MLSFMKKHYEQKDQSTDYERLKKKVTMMVN